MLRPGVQRRQTVRHRVQDERVAGPQQPAGQQGQSLGQDGRGGQGHLVPLCGQAAGEPSDDPQGAHRHERENPHHEHQRVRDQHPRQQHSDHNRDPAPQAALRASTIHDQPGQHQRNRGADVAEGQQQDEDPDAELGSEHQAGRQQHPRPCLPRGHLPVGPLGEQHGEHDHERVGHRRGDVGGVRMEAEETFEYGVLRQLGGHERDIRQIPAVQQHIPVQHVPRHQQVVRLVGILRVGAGYLQVGDEKQDHTQHGRGAEEHAAAGPPGRPASRHGSHHVFLAGVIWLSVIWLSVIDAAESYS